MPNFVAPSDEVIERYRGIARNLRAGLQSRPLGERREALAAIRSMIDEIRIYPRDDAEGRDIVADGDLATLGGDGGMGAMVGLESGRARGRANSSPSEAAVLPATITTAAWLALLTTSLPPSGLPRGRFPLSLGPFLDRPLRVVPGPTERITSKRNGSS